MPKRKPVTCITIGTSIFGEFDKCKVTADHRITIPEEFREKLNFDEGATCILAPEHDGCISVWHESTWRNRIEAIVEDVHNDERFGRMDDLQALGRLLATRHAAEVQRGYQIILPARLRKGVIYSDETGPKVDRYVTIVANGLCLEVWKPQSWETYVTKARPTFWQKCDELSRAVTAVNDG